MKHYSKQTRMLVAIDCIIFGFDGHEVKLLLIQRGFDPEKGKWSLMGGFVKANENFDRAASRILKELTGLEGVYMEQLRGFSAPDRDPVERTISIAFIALINIQQYKKQLSNDYNAEWFPLRKVPRLIFDHRAMLDLAISKLQNKAAFHPILFNLLPEKFTIPQLHSLYEEVYNTTLDKRNFSRKVLSTNLLIKQKDKYKDGSKKGAFFYKIDKRKYHSKLDVFLKFIPNPDKII